MKATFTNETNELELVAMEALTSFISSVTRSRNIKYIINKVESLAVNDINEEDVVSTLAVLRNLTFRGYTHI